MELRYIYGAFFIYFIVMYFVEKNEVEKNTHLLWAIMMFLVQLTITGQKILEILEIENG